MDTNPAVSQADRDTIEDLGLADVLEHIDDAVLLHHDEPMAS